MLTALVWALWPQPVPIDLATASRGAFEVTLREDGQTRVREVYVVSTPIAGRVLRFEGEVGDQVTAGETVLTRILPTDPAILDARRRSELQAAVGAAEANLTLAQAEVRRAQATVDFMESEYERVLRLNERGIVPLSELERALLELRTAETELDRADAAENVRLHELETARAALIEPQESDIRSLGEGCCVTVRAPIDGTILRLEQESESVVQAGAPIAAIGDPRDLEVVVDLLSADAVMVEIGMPVRIENWGGPGALSGAIRRIEPVAETRVSSLGIEEQRVDVIIDLTDPFVRWSRLGHGYRVDAFIILRATDDVLQVPLGALFREDERWSVFRVVDGAALLTPVEIGDMTSRMVEIRSGLEEGATVVLNPSDRVENGTAVVARDVEG
ncbi:MAG: HlyD family efflux transporter periplasmic adaptor subunit [Azospirillaceae bacterium]